MAVQKRLWRPHPAWPMVATAFALRVGAILVLHTYRFPQTDDHYLFGTEMGRIGRALASGHGFASPLHGNTGPTAMVGPLYPLVIAAVFKLTGIYTPGSAIILLGLSALFSSLTALVIYDIGREAFDGTTGLWAGWGWVLSPFAIYWPIRWVWDTGLSTLLFALLFLMTLRLSRAMSTVDGLWYGVLWGGVVLTNTTFLALLPFFLGWLCWRRVRCRDFRVSAAAAVAVAFLLAIAPWLARNYIAFGQVLLRSNLGLELAIGNLADPGDPLAWQHLHPAVNAAEMARYRTLGELRYMAEKQRQVLHFIGTRPTAFLRNTATHILYFWFGSATPAGITHFPEILFGLPAMLAFAGLWLLVRGHSRAAFPFMATVAIFPVIYYFTHPDLRFRHLIEPQLFVMAAYGVSTAARTAAKTVPKWAQKIAPIRGLVK
ncbi:MAG TPA: glycosyltransferase family 39 protein [bacterium]|nr:glycosyltransferase family 39 protein [bacterium]